MVPWPLIGNFVALAGCKMKDVFHFQLKELEHSNFILFPIEEIPSKTIPIPTPTMATLMFLMIVGGQDKREEAPYSLAPCLSASTYPLKSISKCQSHGTILFGLIRFYPVALYRFFCWTRTCCWAILHTCRTVSLGSTSYTCPSPQAHTDDAPASRSA